MERSGLWGKVRGRKRKSCRASLDKERKGKDLGSHDRVEQRRKGYRSSDPSLSQATP